MIHGEEEQDEQFEEELSVQNAAWDAKTAGAKTEPEQVGANKTGCCLLWLNCIWNFLCAVASVGAALVAGVCLVLVIVAEAVWSGLGSLWRGFLLTVVTGVTTAFAFLFLRSRLAVVELFSAMRRGVARAEQLCEAATEEENAADGVVLAEPASDQPADGEDKDPDGKIPPPSGEAVPNKCRGGKTISRAAMRVGGRRRQSAKRQHKTFDPGGPTVDAGAD